MQNSYRYFNDDAYQLISIPQLLDVEMATIRPGREYGRPVGATASLAIREPQGTLPHGAAEEGQGGSDHEEDLIRFVEMGDPPLASPRHVVA